MGFSSFSFSSPSSSFFQYKKWNNELVSYVAFGSPGNIDWTKETLGLKTSPNSKLASDYHNGRVEVGLEAEPGGSEDSDTGL